MGPSPAKGVVNGKKRLREGPSSSPIKKGKAADKPKGKEAASAPEPKRKTTKAGNATCSRAPFLGARGRKLSQSWHYPRIRGLHYGHPLHNREDITGGNSSYGQGKCGKAKIGSDAYHIVSCYWPGTTSILYPTFPLIFYTQVFCFLFF